MANARITLALGLLLAIAIVPFAVQTSNEVSSPTPTHTRPTLYERVWLQLLSEGAPRVIDAKAGTRAGADGGWSPKLITLPLGEGKQSVALPLLVLPVPVQSESDKTKDCDHGAEKSKENEESRVVHEEAVGPRIHSFSPSRFLQPPIGQRHYDDFFLKQTKQTAPPRKPASSITPTITYTENISTDHTKTAKYSSKGNEESRVDHEDAVRLNIPSFSSSLLLQPPTGHRHDEDYIFEQAVSSSPPPPPPASPKTTYTETSTDYTKTAKYTVTQISQISRRLVELFRRQTPYAPELPPAVIPRYGEVIVNHTTSSDAGESSSGSERDAEEDPPRPRFDRSLFMRAELTVYRADYTEPYAVWWDAATGRARIDYHTEDGTSTFRQILPDGRVQHFEMHVDRTEEEDVTRCSRGLPRRVASQHLSHPALPQIELFTFHGFGVSEGVKVERWRLVIRGGPGEIGGAPGEALTFHHELLLRRTSAHYATPVKYTVSVDSSVLGSDCDGYEHRYLEVREWQPQDEGDCHLTPDESGCDALETLDDVAQPEHRAKLEPLREFTLPTRDPRYDAAIEDYKAGFSRQYVDNKEEAVRKNLFIQTSRFVNSGNREGATFEMEINFLADRLRVEKQQLLGVVPAEERIAAEPFPHSERNVESRADALPQSFDWRREGGVTPVRFQGASCMSCWAFAVTAAVEGALFRVTRRLVALSEKALVDCGRETGANGCNPTWPSFAYDYVKEYGLPAREQYSVYNEKVDSCSASRHPPVTNISAHVNVTKLSIPALKVAIKDHAPTLVIVDAKAGSFQNYKKGVLVDKRCGKSPSPLNHAVTAVGWGKGRGKTHFVLKNSWSDQWGERGYVRVFAPSNTCGVLSQPSYPRLERSDVHHSEPTRATVAPDVFNATLNPK